MIIPTSLTLHMNEEEYDSIIEQISQLLTEHKISPDEQDTKIIGKYSNIAKERFHLDDEKSRQLVFEALLYMKIKSSDSVDPLQRGDQFGAGFS